MPVIDGRGTRPVVQSGDLAFLQQKEQEGNLVKLTSAEFSSDADQITFIPPNGKTFFFIKAKLYPVVDTIATTLPAGLVNRRADIEITNDGVVIDVLTHDQEASNSGGGSASATGQRESNIFDSLDGNGVKEFKLVSTNTSGTYRVSLLGYLDNTNTQSFGGQTVTFNAESGDIAFLRNRSREGNLVIVTANLNNAVGEILNFIPPTGKTFFLYKAGITSNTTPSTNTNKQCRVEVRNDGNVVDYLAGSSFIDNLGAGGGANIAKTETTIMGDKLIGDGIKKYSMQAQVNGLACHATLTGWLEDT